MSKEGDRNHADQGVAIGVIGGSGLYEIEGLKLLEEREIQTPFGAPSGPISIGELGGRRVAFLPRHGKHHQYNPSTVPYRANLWALKSLGVFWCVTVSAVGSLREDITPGDMVIPDQIIDKTYKRSNTFFDEIAVHVGLTFPFDPVLRGVLLDAARRDADTRVHEEGTYVCMEGPGFSTRAESMMHRQWGASLIGMTAMPEARLARELEMCYATIALPTDYDVWYQADHVDVNEVLKVLKQNIARVRSMLGRVIPSIPLGTEDECDASRALEHAIMTSSETIPLSTRRKMGLVLEKYIADESKQTS